MPEISLCERKFLNLHRLFCSGENHCWQGTQTYFKQHLHDLQLQLGFKENSCSVQANLSLQSHSQGSQRRRLEAEVHLTEWLSLLQVTTAFVSHEW